MKPHLLRKSDFIGSNPIFADNAAGIIVTRDAGQYHVAVELDVDTIVHMNSTKDKDTINKLIENLIPKIVEIKGQFANCRPE